MAQKDYISEERMSEYDALIKQYIEEHSGGDISIEDKPALGKLLVTLNPDKPNQEQYLVSRDPYEAPSAPTMTAGGDYNGSKTITITRVTSGSTVYYTTDGTTPTLTASFAPRS